MPENITPRLSVVFLGMFMLLSACSDEKTDREYFSKAQQYHHNNKPYESIIELKNVLKLNPEHVEARFLLGQVYLDIGDAAGAEKELRKAREYGNTSVQLGLMLAEALIEQELHEKARNELDKLAATEPSLKAEIYATLARLYLAQNDVPRAASAVDEALALSSAGLRAKLAHTQVLLATGKLEQGKSRIDETLEVYPESSKAWLLSARIAEYQDDFESAVSAYQRVIELEPRGRPTPHVLSARTGLSFAALRNDDMNTARKHADFLHRANKEHYLPNYLLGAIAYREKKYASALEFLQVSYANNNHFAPTSLLLGSVNFALGSYNQAEAHLARYCAQVPQNLTALRLLSTTYLRLGEPGKALESLAGALDYNPSDAQLLSMVGEMAVHAGKYELGEEYIRKAMALGGDKRQGQLQLATTFMSAGDFPAAIRELENLDASGESDFAGTRKLILAYLQNNQTKQALQKAQSYLDAHPDENRAYNMLGAVYMVMNDLASARRQFEIVLSKDNADLPTLINLARVSLAERKLDESNLWLEKALTKDPNNVLVMMLLAQVAEGNGATDSALGWLEKARNANKESIPPRLRLANLHFKTGGFDKAHAYIDEILSIQAKHYLALGLRVDIYLRQNELEKAINAAQDWAIATNQPEAFTKLGILQYARQKSKQARKSFEQAIALNADFLPAVNALANLEFKEGRPERALQLARRMQETNPQSDVGYILEGDIHMANKEFQNASKKYQLAYEKKNSGMAAFRHAHATLKAGQAWPAISRLLEMWLTNHPLDQQARLQFATLARTKGQMDIAIQSYRMILDQQPDNAVVLNDLAWTLYEARKDPQALELARRAVELDPQAAALDTYGWISLSEGEVKTGLEMLKRAHEQMPSHPDIAYHYAYALYQAGQAGQSKALIEKILESDVTFSSRAEAEALRKQL